MTIGCRAAGAAAGVFLMMMMMIGATPSRAATLPAGFTEALVASGLNNPTAMQFAPDGRLFVCEQGGRLRVIKDGALLSTPFLTVTVSASGERGLLGVAFDPNFAVNQYVYVYYTATSPAVHNRVSRFTANGDVAVPGSEVVILDLDNLSSATNHNGGALNFGPDGKLYVSVGENANPSNAQTLSNLLGKVLRLNSDGTIPTDNPFYASATGKNRRDLGARPAQPLHLCLQSVGVVDVHQRRRTIGLRRDQRRRQGRELRLAGHRRRDDRSALRQPSLQLRARRRRLRNRRRRVLLPRHRAVSLGLPERLFLRRLLRRLDSQARSGERQRWSRPSRPALHRRST